jgi:hypothetical protein
LYSDLCAGGSVWRGQQQKGENCGDTAQHDALYHCDIIKLFSEGLLVRLMAQLLLCIFRASPAADDGIEQ